MNKDLVTVKLWASTRRGLKILAAERGVPMTVLVDTLLASLKEKKDVDPREIERSTKV